MKIAMMAALGVAALESLGAGVAPAAAQGVAAPLAQAYPGESYTQYRRYYGRPGPRYYRRGGGGVGAGALLGGLAAGAIIGGAIASQAQPRVLPKTEDPDFIAYCARRYRSFDPVSGTYLASDGLRYPCE